MICKNFKKKGQLSVFVIIGVVIVAAVLVFLFIKKDTIFSPKSPEDPRSLLQGCLEESVKKIVDEMIPQGGFIVPKKKVDYRGINYTYMCYIDGSFGQCLNLHPMLINEIRNEIINYTREDVERCFQNMKSSLEKKGNAVSLGEKSYDIQLIPGKIKVIIGRRATISIGDSTKEISNFNFDIDSPIYNLANVAMEIANSEAKYCYFEYVGYMMLYPQFDIRRDITGDYTRVYTIEYKKTGDTMGIATRSCAIPVGLGV